MIQFKQVFSLVSHLCGDKMEVRVLGNAPWAVYKFKYPKKIQEKLGKIGEKVKKHSITVSQDCRACSDYLIIII